MEPNNTTNNIILYLDYCKTNQKELINALEDSYTLLVAHETTDALELINRFKIKVLIFDVQLSEESDITFIKKVNTNHPQIVNILIIKPNLDTKKLSLAHKLDLFGILKKPISGYELSVTVKNAITFYDLKEEQQSLQQQLQIVREKAMESDLLKSNFVANISHEIRTPLNGIIGFLSLIEDKEIDPEKLKKYKRIIDESTNKFLHIMEDLLVVSQLELGTVRKTVYEFDLVKFFDNIYENHKPHILHKKISFIKKGTEEYDKLTVRADKAKLHSVFYHLLNNALKFTNSGYIEFGILSMDKNIFYVKDTGIGVSQDKQNNIFQIFRQESDKILTREYGGCGLGLSIARSYVELLGGEIWLESEKNKGSTFFFKFPVEHIFSTCKKSIVLVKN